MKNIFLIGIGGIGMSALARYFLHEGKRVAGYDRTRTPLTEELEREGARIQYSDDPNLIPIAFKESEYSALVVYTPAVGNDCKVLDYFRKNRNRVVKRAQALGVIAADKRLLAVAGTHGKTSVSTMLAHILTEVGTGCSAFMGGISKNYNSNLLLAKNNLLVAEADEYDRSFLQLFPEVMVVTSVDPDHLDIYGNIGELRKAFKDFINQLKPRGALIINKRYAAKDRPSFMQYFDKKMYTYAVGEPADFYADSLASAGNGYYTFDLHTPGGVVRECTLGAPGRINVENAVAAAVVVTVIGGIIYEIPRVLP